MPCSRQPRRHARPARDRRCCPTPEKRSPRPPEGGARSATNAPKHGLRARRFGLLPGEDQAEWAPLVRLLDRKALRRAGIAIDGETLNWLGSRELEKACRQAARSAIASGSERLRKLFWARLKQFMHVHGTRYHEGILSICAPDPTGKGFSRSRARSAPLARRHAARAHPAPSRSPSSPGSRRKRAGTAFRKAHGRRRRSPGKSRNAPA